MPISRVIQLMRRPDTLSKKAREMGGYQVGNAIVVRKLAFRHG